MGVRGYLRKLNLHPNLQINLCYRCHACIKKYVFRGFLGEGVRRIFKFGGGGLRHIFGNFTKFPGEGSGPTRHPPLDPRMVVNLNCDPLLQI